MLVKQVIQRLQPLIMSSHVTLSNDMVQMEVTRHHRALPPTLHISVFQGPVSCMSWMHG